MRLTMAAARLLHHTSVEIMDVVLAVLMLLTSWESQVSPKLMSE